MVDYEGIVARLHHAFRWDCDSCGRENFVRAISMEREYIESKLGEDIETDGDYVLYPAIVVCQHCTSQYLSSFNEFSDLEDEE